MLFERALVRETLSSEKTRTSILAVLFGSLLITYLVAMLLFPSLHSPLFHNNPALPALGLGLATAYELLARVVIGRFFKNDREIPFIGRYANAFVESSLPTLAIILAARLLDPATALSSPPPLRPRRVEPASAEVPHPTCAWVSPWRGCVQLRRG